MGDDVYSAGEEAEQPPANDAGDMQESQVDLDAQELGMEDEDKGEYGDEMGDDEVGFSNSAADLNQEELEAIIESITSGKSQQYKKLQF